MLNDETSHQTYGMHDLHGPNRAELPARRGPGRPPGSPNRPKEPPMSAMQREALKDALGASYRDAIVARTLAETRTRGLTALIKDKLGKGALAEIQSEIIREHETGSDAAAATEVSTRAREAA